MQALLNRMTKSFPATRSAEEWKLKIGEDVYHKFQRMRVRQLKGEVRVFGESHPIEYFISDQGKAKRLIFLPGFADTKENFYNCAQFLIKEYDICVPDLPGFGRSFRHDDTLYSLKNYAQWLTNFIDHIGWTDFHLIGNSLGGSVAVELALSMPERIKSLTLADCGGVVFRDRRSIYQEFVNDRVIFKIDSPLQFNYFLHRVFHKPPVIPPLVWNYLYKEFTKYGDWHIKVLSDLIEGIRTLDDPKLDEVVLNDRIRDISVPTFIVWGDEDTFFPVSTAGFMHSQIEGSQIYIISDCGHGPHAEAPYKFAKAVRKFMSRLP